MLEIKNKWVASAHAKKDVLYQTARYLRRHRLYWISAEGLSLDIGWSVSKAAQALSDLSRLGKATLKIITNTEYYMLNSEGEVDLLRYEREVLGF